MVYISEPRLDADAGDSLVTANLSGIEPAGTLRQRLPGRFVPSQAAMNDSVFSVGLLLSMANGSPLELEGPVSARLVEQSETVQEIFSCWYPEVFRPVAIRVESRSDDLIAGAGRVMSTFTAGVDSLYTYELHKDELTSFVYVHGFDIPLQSRKMRSEMSNHLQDAASSAVKDLIQGVSNVRRFLNPHMSWASMSHGAAISGFCHLVSDTHSRLLLPASYTYDNMFPWGSHPLLDPLWSTERLTLEHDGAGASRTKKTKRIAVSAIAQDHLKVCFQRDGTYNCGKCKKCIRTRIALQLTGKLGEFKTFPESFRYSEVAKFSVANAGDLAFAEDNYKFAMEVEDINMAEALDRGIERYRLQRN